MKMRARAVTTLFLGASLISIAVAEEPLVTDRPDFTESSSSVGKNIVQLEAGSTYAEFSGGGEITTLGEILVRWGVLESLELRIQLPSYEWDDDGSGRRSGSTNSALGFKFELAEGTGTGLLGGMEAAVIGMTTVPTGTADFASSQWQPAAVLAVGWDLSSRLGLGVNLGVARPEDDGNRFTSAWLSSALGVGLTDDLSWFLELIAFDREAARGPNTLTFQTGLVYLLSSDLQLDVRAARRLTDQGVDLLIGAGVSWRLGG